MATGHGAALVDTSKRAKGDGRTKKEKNVLDVDPVLVPDQQDHTVVEQRPFHRRGPERKRLKPQCGHNKARIWSRQIAASTHVRHRAAGCRLFVDQRTTVVTVLVEAMWVKMMAQHFDLFFSFSFFFSGLCLGAGGESVRPLQRAGDAEMQRGSEPDTKK